MQRQNPVKLILAALCVGVTIAFVYRIFAVSVEHAQHWLWFDIGKTEEHSLMAIPIAVIGGLVMAGFMLYLKERGHQEIGHSIPELLGSTSEITVLRVARTIAIGFVSLAVGASLGLEGVLIPVAYGIGYLIAQRFKVNTRLIGLMGVIGLLAAFFNGYAAALVPVGFALAAKKKDAKTTARILFLGTIAATASIGVLRLVRHTTGYISLPDFGEINISLPMIVVAVIIAAVAATVPFFLDGIINTFNQYTKKLPEQWYWQGLIAGLGIGIIYAIIGPIGYFSGEHTMSELITQNADYTALQLIVLAVGKLLVTGWSIATIYRGGPVFPQLFAAVCLALLLTGAVPDSAWLVTVLLSAFFGVFTGAMGSLFIAAAFVLPLFGIATWPLVLASAVGASLTKHIFSKKFTKANAV